jgi:general secretion pathway protein F
MNYKIYYQDNSRIKTLILNSLSLKSLQSNPNLPQNIIFIQTYNKLSFQNIFQKNETLDLIYEFKTMLNSQLLFEDIVEILLKTTTNKQNIEVLNTIKYAINNGQKIANAITIDKKYLDNEVILFFKIAQENTNFYTAIDALYEVLINKKKIQDDLTQALTYPLVLALSLLVSIVIIFSFVIPKFEHIYTTFGDKLPYSTQLLLDMRYIFNEYSFIFGLFVVAVFMTISVLYSKYQIWFDKILLLHIPIFSNLHKHILFYKLFLSLHLIVKSKYKFQNALNDSKDIIQNTYCTIKLNDILQDMNNGVNISRAFSNTKVFDTSTISLLKIAQKSDNLEHILYDIKNIYHKKVQKSMYIFKASFEPLLIFIMASIILFIVLAIMSPIWDLSTVIN